MPRTIESFAFSTAVLLVSATSIAGDAPCPGNLRTVPIHGPSAIDAVATNGELAVTWDDFGLTVWDLRDPTAIRPLGSYVQRRGWRPSYLAPEALYLHPDNWALVLPRMTAFDLRNPAQPEPRPLSPGWPYEGRASSSDPWQRVAINDDLLAATAGVNEIRLLDLEDPFSGLWLNPTWPGLDHPESLTFSDGRLVVLDRLGGIQIYGLGDPANPNLLGSTALAVFNAFGWSLVGSGNVALAISRVNEWWTSAPIDVWSIDLSDPANPVAGDVTSFFEWSFVRQAWFTGRNSVVFADDFNYPGPCCRLFELDWSDPQNPVVVTSRQVPLTDVALSSTGVVGSLEDRLEIFDRTVDFPTLGASPIEGVAVDLAVTGATGVTADGNAGITALDLSDPSSPVVASRLDLDGEVRAVRLVGTTAIAVVVDVHDWSLVTIDVADPNAPSVLAVLPIRPGVRDLSWDGDLVALGIPSYTSEGLVDIVDVSDPSAPFVRSTFSTGIMSSSQMRVRLSGSTAIVGSLDAVISMDLADPDNPAELDRIEINGFEVTELEIIGNRAVAVAARELYVIDISDPTSLLEIEHYGGYWSDMGAPGAGLLATQIASYTSWLEDYADLASPISYPAPLQMRWWNPGVILGDAWLRPSGPFLDIASLECRAPEAGFRWAGLGNEIWFVDTSSYQIDSHTWDFGDGTISSVIGTDPKHDYASPGRYDVALTVTNPQGSDTYTEVIEVGTRVFWDGFETSDEIAWGTKLP